ncbi:hypothetical protein [Sporosarcina trichiuri]|uniref:hypothetical protein n=1 Tax=Sporosarcina trichiuri TaxID=3056445 RepID=UPI0025B47993|nr:hypothetical protein [Sporosarcina sp. 0.2-SM1T-5]WJY27282.1 hypothetical protein QWT68_14770 [Sporosarcina sp. 0.2-SM1T-5]
MVNLMVTGIIFILIIVVFISLAKNFARLSAEQTIRARKLEDVDRKLDKTLELLEEKQAEDRQA